MTEQERRKRSVEIGDLTTDPVKFAEHMGFELQPRHGARTIFAAATRPISSWS